MKNRNFLVIFFLMTILFLSIVATMVLARAYSIGGSLNAKGDLISGWYWLRSKGHNADWVFDASKLSGARSGSVYINVNALVTNKSGGGAGYGTTVKLSVSGGGKTQTITVDLRNPFKPQDADDSGGLGYSCYGAGGPLNDNIWKNGGQITVSMEYPFSNNYHVAVNQGILTLGFRK